MVPRRKCALIFLALLIFGTVSTSPTPGQDYGFGTFDIFSWGSSYWNKMTAGFNLEAYDDGELMDEVLYKENPDVKLNITELIQKYGFPVETHTIFTEDDYVLTLHRIPHGRWNGNGGNETSGEKSNRPVALVHHGLCSSSVDWIMNTADKALAYKLADAGYDVWLANARGNRYSNRHITMTSKRSKFWDFSWHDIGVNDLPAVIDHILEETGQKQVNYIGHSMGTTIFFVLMAMKPEYNAKIRTMVAMGPAVHMEYMTSPVRYLARFSNFEKFIYDFLGNGEIIPDTLLRYIHRVAPSSCTGNDTLTTDICDNIIYAIGGFNKEQMNMTQMPVILAHTPSPCSTKCGIHFLQGVSSAQFRQYDYGLVGNLMKYGQLHPPAYDMSKVTVPVWIFWAENDILVDPRGIPRLEMDLPNFQGSVRVNNSFTHIDFLFAKDADKLVYNRVLDILEKQPETLTKVNGHPESTSPDPVDNSVLT